MDRFDELNRLGESLNQQKISRRAFLGKGLALGFSMAVLAPILAACGSSSDTSSSTTTAASGAPTNKKIRVLGIAVALQDAQLKQFTADTGYEIEPVIDTLTGMMTKMLTASDEYDCIENNATYMAPVWDAGVIAPIPVEKIPNWKDAIPLFTDPNAPGAKYGWPMSQTYTDDAKTAFKGVPTFFNFEAMGYNQAKIPGGIDSYAAMYDSKYRNKVAIWNDAVWTIGMTANYLVASGQMPAPATNIGDLSTSEVDTVVAYLTKKKQEGQFRAIWSDYGQSVNLLASQEAWLADAWNPAFNDAARQSKLPLIYINPKEGNRPWYMSIALSKKAKNPEGVYAFANWKLGGWYGAQIAPLGYYSPTTTVKAAMEPAAYEMWYGGKGRPAGSYDERVANVAYWPGWPQQYEYYLAKWSAFLAS